MCWEFESNYYLLHVTSSYYLVVAHTDSSFIVNEHMY